MRTSYWTQIAFLCSLCGFQSAVAAAVTAAEAESVLSEYCQALVAGDIQSLQALMGGNHLKEKKELLNDPAYADFLQSRYSGSQCMVDESTAVEVGSDQVEASLSIQLSGNDIVVTRFRLGREDGQLRVIDELTEATE